MDQASDAATAAPTFEPPNALIKRVKRLGMLLIGLTGISMLFGNIGLVSIASLIIFIMGVRVSVGRANLLQRAQAAVFLWCASVICIAKTCINRLFTAGIS